MPFEVVVARHAADVWRFSASQVGRDRADDVFQETMLAALAAYPTLRDPDAVRPWLPRIAARKSIDLLPGQARLPRWRSPSPQAAGTRAARPPPPLRDENPVGPGGRAQPEKQRQAVGLRFLLDLGDAEIGAAMETSTDAARRDVFEGLRTLRRQTDGGGAPEAASHAGVDGAVQYEQTPRRLDRG